MARARGEIGSPLNERCEPCQAGGNVALNHRVRDFDDETKVREHLKAQFPEAPPYSLDSSVKTWREFREKWNRSAPSNVVELDQRRERFP